MGIRDITYKEIILFKIFLKHCLKMYFKSISQAILMFGKWSWNFKHITVCVLKVKGCKKNCLLMIGIHF